MLFIVRCALRDSASYLFVWLPLSRSLLEPRWEADNERPLRRPLFIALRATSCYRKETFSLSLSLSFKKVAIPPFASLIRSTEHFTEVDSQGPLTATHWSTFSSSSHWWCPPWGSIEMGSPKSSRQGASAWSIFRYIILFSVALLCPSLLRLRNNEISLSNCCSTFSWIFLNT